MANVIVKNLPNSITSCNLFCGCIASYMAFQSKYEYALLFIVLGAVFDFFDGMTARLLHVSSFGLAPAAIAFSLFKEVHYPAWLESISHLLPYTAFLIAVFSALRLAKFNLDERQSTSFIGMPTPANALFWGSLVVGEHAWLVSENFNALYLLVLVLVMSLLLVAELPMFSLKFKDLSCVSIPLLVIFQLSGFAAVILWYILLSILTRKKS